MNQKTELKKSMETYVLLILMTGIFLTTIMVAAALTDQNVFAMLPKFSWNMVNSWDEIINR
ncbi:hypothetical protein FZC76_11125 [Sutcliffiella horikoshii]|uniref:Uncharacterized protein n=1 Tax=Sutcliffiella horikoshii TaxID=79883 RepID=A0A5D4T1F4_9BACI|nr:hypothetical protein [Sutcliffiella horikoshii]TYS68282.1 hypothetical protein FZC76_11125 [Sutcliffiella horikoshii]